MPDDPTPQRFQDDDQPVVPTTLSPDQRATTRDVMWLGSGLLFLAILLAYLFVSLWPSDFTSTTQGAAPTWVIWVFTDRGFRTTADVRLLMTVMLAGGMGSYLHTATSFADFVGNGKLTRSWMWWYVLKPFIGMGLAVMFYLVVRGGFLSSGADAGKINLYGITGLAAMAGMFSKQATDKLDEIFTTVFRTSSGGGDAKRGGDLTNDVPVLTDVVPSSLEMATSELAVEVKGSHFVKGSVVRVAGTSRETVFNSDGALTVTLLPTDVAKDGTLEVVVFNPPPGGGTSTPLKLTVAPAVAQAAAEAVAAQGAEAPPVPDTAPPAAPPATDAEVPPPGSVAPPEPPSPAPAGGVKAPSPTE